MDYRNRIIGIGEERASQLLANPFNFRIHPLAQQKIMEGILEEIGYIQSVLVNKPTGHVIDGHMRVALALQSDGIVPVSYVDLSLEEEKKALYFFDRIGIMAVIDKEQEVELGNDLDIQNEILAALVEERTQSAPAPPKEKSLEKTNVASLGYGLFQYTNGNGITNLALVGKWGLDLLEEIGVKTLIIDLCRKPLEPGGLGQLLRDIDGPRSRIGWALILLPTQIGYLMKEMGLTQAAHSLLAGAATQTQNLVITSARIGGEEGLPFSRGKKKENIYEIAVAGGNEIVAGVYDAAHHLAEYSLTGHQTILTIWDTPGALQEFKTKNDATLQDWKEIPLQ